MALLAVIARRNLSALPAGAGDGSVLLEQPEALLLIERLTLIQKIVFNAATPDTPTLNAAPAILAALFLGFLIYRILRDVFVGKRISSEKIFGAVCAYLLIGFLFSISLKLSSKFFL